MTETFDHLFGGWHEAKARRWVNPDGSQGGIVAVDAEVSASATIRLGAEVFPNASIGSYASIGHSARIDRYTSIGHSVRIGHSTIIDRCVSIGDNVRIGSYTRIGSYASIGHSARIDRYTSIGGNTSIGEGDWLHFAGHFGAHASVVTVVHSKKHGLRWWVGCQDGITTEQFIELLSESHAPDGEADDVCREYAHLIGFVTTHPEVVRREKARGETK